MTFSICLVLSFLTFSADLALGEAADAQPAREKAKAVVPGQASMLPLDEVRLLDGPFKTSQNVHAKYLLSLEPDRLAARYRSEAGLTPKAKCYPGWEDVDLPGVGAGFYLSGCSWMYAATGDRRFLEQIEYLLAELEECQMANGNGFLLATKDAKKIFAQIEQGDIQAGPGWSLNGQPEPYYAMEKLIAGLRDVWRNTHLRKSLDIWIRWGDWMERHMSHLNDERMRKIMTVEYGGINRVLADLFVETNDPRYLALSRRWDDRSLFDPLSRGQDVLPGNHANTQFPKISGLAARYPYSGEPGDRITSQFFWDRVVHHHSYATGDNSLSEHFGPPDRLSDRLNETTTETCNAWNMVRLTELLFAVEPRAEYGDFVERILWNHILPAQHPCDGRVCYFLSLESGKPKTYESLYDSFRCCTCSSMDSYARHGGFIYGYQAETLFVNLYIASELDWREKGIVVRQETRLPESGDVRFLWTCKKPSTIRLALRCPHWATEGFSLAINGEKQPLTGRPGNFVVVEREWKSGDRLDVSMPLTVRMESMPDNARRVALFKGPVLLVGDLGPTDDPRAGDIDYVPRLAPGDRPFSTWLKPMDRKPMELTLDKVGIPRDVIVRPFYEVHDRRYVVYWDILNPKEADALRGEFEKEKAREAALSARTIDRVLVGEDGSEAAHHFAGERTGSGFGAYGQYMDRRWRDAHDGWFSYEMKVQPDRPAELCCTYWGGEQGDRTFDILVDQALLTTEKLTSSKPNSFYDKMYPIPEKFTHEKKSVVIQFKAHSGNTAGGVFGIRVLDRKGVSESAGQNRHGVVDEKAA